MKTKIITNIQTDMKPFLDKNQLKKLENTLKQNLEHFDVIKKEEVRASTTYVNFSSLKNYSEDLKEHVNIFIPRVGPVTVAMCLRNVVRLHSQFQNKSCV